MIFGILIILAGAMGAAGVVLAAAAAHAAPGAGLDSAAQMLLFHAVAVLAGTSLLHQGLLWRPAAIAALAAFIIGAMLFAAAIALHVLWGFRMFPMAAPTGGTVLIGAWIIVVVAALVRRQ
jgi:uncharacterized membrane protein YgdD (TMEM256/DUF423 family)